MMTNTRVPANGNYNLMPTAIDSRRLYLHFGNTDAADEASELVSFLQRRGDGWKSFTTHEYHDWICDEGQNCKNRSEKRCAALIATKLVEFTDGHYFITTQFVDICAAAAFE